jgi:short-subunit dehydrogenase
MMRRRFQSILITGASSSIGAALAKAYAAPTTTLSLTGRHGERLALVADHCRAAGAAVRTATVDVADEPAMTRQLVEWDEISPFDLVIANAGVGHAGEVPPGGGWQETLRATTATNVVGTINTIEPLLPRLLARQRGQIALVSSLAGFIGLPPAPAYGASKAWMRVYGEALRGALAAQGIGVSVICPGFVTTPMTAGNRRPMPFLMPAERAAAIIASGLAANRGRIAFPWPMVAAIRLLQMMPVSWAERLLRPRCRASGDAPTGH